MRRRCLQDWHPIPSNIGAQSSRCPALLASQGHIEEAARIPLTILQAESGNVRRSNSWPRSSPTSATPSASSPWSRGWSARRPKNTWAHYYAASLFFIQDRPDQALQAARNAVGDRPAATPRRMNLIGACLASMGQTDAARTGIRGVDCKADPREPGTYTNLATLELQTGNRDRARQLLCRSADHRSDQRRRRARVWRLDGEAIEATRMPTSHLTSVDPIRWTEIQATASRHV